MTAPAQDNGSVAGGARDRRWLPWLFAPVLLLPLLVAPQLVFPFVATKVLALRALVAALVAATAVLWARRVVHVRRPRSPLDVAALALLLMLALSCLLSVDRQRSLHDSHDRMLGIVTILHYWALYFVLAAVVRRPQHWQRLWTVLLAAGGLVVCLGVVQRFVPGFLWGHGARAASTLGHPTYLGGLGVFLVFGAWFARGWARAAAVLAGIAGVVISETRGSLLALAVGVAVLAACHARTRPRPARRRRLRRALAVTAALAAITLLAAAFGHMVGLDDAPLLRRLYVHDAGGGSAGTRLLTWHAAFDAWTEHPILGWGPSTFFHAFNAHYPPEMLRHGEAQTWVDQGHNVLVHLLVENGVLGLAAYLGLHACALWLVIRGIRRGVPLASSRAETTRGEAYALIALLAARHVHLMFLFEEPTSYLLLVFVLAYIAARTARNDAAARERPARASARAAIAAATVLLAGTSVLVHAVRPALANLHVREALAATGATQQALRRAGTPGEPHARARAAMAAHGRRAIEQLERAADLGSPYRSGASEMFTEAVIATLEIAAERGVAKRAAQDLAPVAALYACAAAELEHATLRHACNIRTRLQRLRLEIAYATLCGDRARLAVVAADVRAHAFLSPRRQAVHLELARAEERLGRTAAARADLLAVIELAPDQAAGYLALAELLHRAGDGAAARDALERLAANAEPTARERERIARLRIR